MLSLFHYYTAGFGLLQETVHRGIHLSFVLGLVFLVFPAMKSGYREPARSTWLRPLGISILAWALEIGPIAAGFPLTLLPFSQFAFLVCNPTHHALSL